MGKSKKFLSFLIFSILFFLISISFIYLISLSPYDELWNFQNIYKMYNGLDIYKDANVIITPIFYILSLGFFKLLGATIISFRILNVILYSTLFLLIYFIFKYLKVSKHFNFIFLALIFTQVFQVVNCGANYSILSFIFILLGVLSYFYLSEKKYFHFLQGFLIYLTFFTKQNLGVYYAISILIYEFIYRKNIKHFIINQIKKFIIFISLLLISLYILYNNGILFDFINYAFGGLFNFGSSNLTIATSPYLVFVCIATLILYFFVNFNKKVFNENVFSKQHKQNFNLLGCITIGVTFSVFPILNTAHFIFIMPFYFILLFYFFDITILEDFFSSDKAVSIAYILTLCILFFVLIRVLFFHYVEEKDFIQIQDASSPFNNIFVSEEYYEKIDVLSDYIINEEKNGKKVIIISFDSAFPMINLKKSNQEFDLVFNGNLGYNGENKMIEKIKSSTNTTFLILTDEDDCFWQESKVIRNFITNNLSKKGELLDYSIYELNS